MKRSARVSTPSTGSSGHGFDSETESRMAKRSDVKGHRREGSGDLRHMNGRK